MAYTIIWTNSAIEDLRELVRYIAANDPIAAERLGNANIKRVEGIADFPGLEGRFLKLETI